MFCSHLVSNLLTCSTSSKKIQQSQDVRVLTLKDPDRNQGTLDGFVQPAT
eukprot:m.267707 g.267707  ORF g.267707 m.267707 type:complete len:50 (+) comp11071_c1_seq2:3521-3670(+)